MKNLLGKYGKGQRMPSDAIGILAASIILSLAFFSSHSMADLNSFKPLERTPEIQEDIGNGIKRDRGPAELDADEPFIRFVEDGASVILELDCDSRKQNYLTVKVWGGSGSGGGRLNLKDGGMLLRQRKSNPFPGRFYYATYPIPMNKTKGNSEVEVTLEYQGAKPGPDVYNIYTHLGGFFRPPANEMQGEPFKLGPPRPDKSGQEVSLEEAYEYWTSEANRLIRHSLNQQLFGDKWKRKIEKGEVPEWTWGALVTRFPAPGSDYKRTQDTEIKKWGGILLRNTLGNMGALLHYLVYAKAYKNEWSDFYQDEEMLHRIVAAMDFYCRAQGKNGGFLGPGIGKDVNKPTWIGGPERGKGHHGLEVGQQYLYHAFSTLREDIEKRGLLNASIDHDLDPDTPEVSRRKAYAEMAKRSFKRMSRQVVSRPILNQSMLNYASAYRIYQVLQTTDPEWAEENKERMVRLAEITTGVRRNPQHDHYMFSPKGLSNEVGYSAGYGSGNPHKIAGIAKMTDYQVVKERVPKAFEAYSHFLYLGNDPDGYRRLNKVEWISSRACRSFPCAECY